MHLHRCVWPVARPAPRRHKLRAAGGTHLRGLRSLPHVSRLVPVLLLEDRRGMKEPPLGRLKSEPLVLRALPALGCGSTGSPSAPVSAPA